MIDLAFNGMRWAAHPLQDGAANPTVAHNLWRRNAVLEPLAAGKKLDTVPSAGFGFARQFFLHDDRFVATERRIDMATTQVARDKARRLYFVDNGLLQQLPLAEIPVSFPTPVIDGRAVGVFRGIGTPRVGLALNPGTAFLAGTEALLGAFDQLPDRVQDEYVETAVVFTYVNKYGEEGMPSTPSAITKVRADETVMSISIGVGTLRDPDIIGIRVYIVVEGEYFRIGDPSVTVPGTDTTVDVELTSTDQVVTFDTVYAPSKVTDLLVTGDWASPPKGLEHLASLENGMLAVADEHNVYLSEPYQWHAFPTANTFPVEGLIRRIARIDGGMAVLTDRDVRFFLGATPETMQEVSRRYPHAIGDPASLVDIDGGLGYVTDEGVAVIYAGGGQIATDGWIDRAQWSERVTVSEARMTLYDGRLILATRHPGTGNPIGYVLNLAAQEVTSFDISEAALASGFFRDPRTGAVGYVIDGAGLAAFNEGDPLEARWESGDIPIPGAVAFGALRVEADAYPVEVTIKPAGQPHVVTSLPSARPRRIRAGHRARRLRIAVRTRAPVASVRLAPDLRSA